MLYWKKSSNFKVNEDVKDYKTYDIGVAALKTNTTHELEAMDVRDPNAKVGIHVEQIDLRW